MIGSSVMCSLGKLGRNEDGMTVLEFAVILPVLMIMLLGAFDVGMQIYMQSVLDGAVQKSARDSTLETAPNDLENIDGEVIEQVNTLVSDAEVKIDRQSYYTFFDVKRAESFTDANENGICDNGEIFEDENGNQEYDTDIGEEGIGGPKDVVLYTVTVSYNRIIPLHALVPKLGSKVVLSSQTVLKNQPYGDQAINTTTTSENCID